GDFVVLNWRAVCGTCRACRRGRPWYCFAAHNAAQKMTLTDGTVLTPALGVGAFVEKTLVHAGQCTKVDPQARPAAVGRLGGGGRGGPTGLRRQARDRGGERTRTGEPRRPRGGQRLRRGGRRGHRRRGTDQTDDSHRRARRRTKARVGEE